MRNGGSRRGRATAGTIGGFGDSGRIGSVIALLAVAKIAVLRDGNETEVLPSDLVEDDVLVIRAGDQIPVDGTIVIVVGPEGGLTPAERAQLTAAGAVEARLGPQVLRTSTAGPIAVALLQSRTPRWSDTYPWVS